MGGRVTYALGYTGPRRRREPLGGRRRPRLHPAPGRGPAPAADRPEPADPVPARAAALGRGQRRPPRARPGRPQRGPPRGSIAARTLRLRWDRLRLVSGARTASGTSGAISAQTGLATQFGSSRLSVASGSEPWPRTGVVERPQVEARPVAGGQLAAQALDLALADLVGQRLARPADVAVGLDDRVGLGQAGRPEEVDRALARPAQRVEPGVDDEPGRAPGLRVEHPEALGLVPEQAHLVGQPLAVQAPALDVRAADHPRPEAAERDQVRRSPSRARSGSGGRAPPRG